MRKIIQGSKNLKQKDSDNAHHDVVPSQSLPASGGHDSLTLADFYRYRKQRGVNLGSWFTLERWIAGQPFRQAHPPAESDYDVALGDGAKEILEHHWDTWITADAWSYLGIRGINTVRIPIGYYHICGVDPSVIQGTDFAPFHSVFEGAWKRITAACDEALRHGIGVLIDLHAASGKQNRDAHSGKTGEIRFYSEQNKRITRDALVVLARELGDRSNVVGLQLLNEPQNDPSLPGWYASTIDAVHEVAPDLPLYIHDAWNTAQYARLAGSRSEFVVVDHHLYRCFTPEDHRLSGDEHASNLLNNFQETLKSWSEACHGNLVIAEFSAALNPASLRSPESGEQDRQRRVFARAELELFERHCAGWYFWTYKKGGWDAGWSLRDTITAEIMPSNYGIRRKDPEHFPITLNPSKRDETREVALGGHSGYWSQYKGKYEHWRFSDGFTQGWDDAYWFFTQEEYTSTSIPELGFTGQWCKRRLSGHVKEKGSSNNLWEYEHGFNQGVKAASSCFLSTY